MSPAVFLGLRIAEAHVAPYSPNRPKCASHGSKPLLLAGSSVETPSGRVTWLLPGPSWCPPRSVLMTSAVCEIDRRRSIKRQAQFQLEPRPTKFGGGRRRGWLNRIVSRTAASPGRQQAHLQWQRPPRPFCCTPGASHHPFSPPGPSSSRHCPECSSSQPRKDRWLSSRYSLATGQP
jgi:hypothetical protein